MYALLQNMIWDIDTKCKVLESKIELIQTVIDIRHVNVSIITAIIKLGL